MLQSVSPEKTTSVATLNPSKIMQVGMGFWASKVLLTATRLELFTLLAPAPLSAKEIKEKLELHCANRHVYDWLDALVSLGFLERKGVLDEGLYANAEDTDFFLDKKKPAYMGGILEMANNRLYRYWDNLEDGLRTGQPQNEGKGKPQDNMAFFNELYEDEEKLQEFMDAMTGIQTGNFKALVKTFAFGKYKTMLDVGGADGWLSIQVCLHHPSIQCTTFDLPPVAPLAKRKIDAYRLADRIKVASGDLLNNELPKADLVTMGNILHGLNEERKREVVKKVYDLLPQGGAFIAIENIIDDDRRQNTFGMLMSLNMLIENGEAFDYTMRDFDGWAKEAGFTRTELLPLSGPTSAAVAYKE